MSPARVQMREVAGWLNQDRLVMDDWFNQEFLNISNLTINHKSRSQRSHWFIRLVNGLSDLESKAFCLAKSAVLRYEEEHFGEANDLIQKANKIYFELKDDYDRSLTGYMHSVALGKLGNKWKAADGAVESLLFLANDCNFDRCSDERRKNFLVNIASDLLDSPIHVYKSFFISKKSRLDPLAQQMGEEIRQRVEGFQGTDVQEQAKLIEREISTLIRVAQHEGVDNCNYGETLAFCGLMYLLMGERVKAVEKFNIAMPLYDQCEHVRPLLNWLIRTTQADMCHDQNNKTPVKVNNLLSGLEKCIQDIELLRVAADKKNQRKSSNWYSCQQAAMQSVSADLTESIWQINDARNDYLIFE